MTKRNQNKYQMISLKSKLIKAVEQNVYASISPYRALLILKALEKYIPSTDKYRNKFINYTTEGLRK